MIKKVNELSGIDLDIAMALALGFEMELSAAETWRWTFWGSDFYPKWYNNDVEKFRPTKDWGFMGPLIDHHGIEFKWVSDATIETYSYTLVEKHAHGLNHLESACRLLVLSVVGEEIMIPGRIVEVYNGKSSC